MKQSKAWPPPDWAQVIVSWDYILATAEINPNDLYQWCETHFSTGRFHVHGWKKIHGFAFRFEDPRDAVLFALRWI